MVSDGYISLSPSRFISREDMKQILTLISITKIFSYSSNPFIYGILMSTKRRSKKFGLNSDNATTGSLAVYTSMLLASFPLLLSSIAALKVVVISGSSSTINILFQNRCCSLVRVLYASCFCVSKKKNPPELLLLKFLHILTLLEPPPKFLPATTISPVRLLNQSINL